MATFTIPDKSAVVSVGATDAIPIWQSGGQHKATATQIVQSVPMTGDSGAGGAIGAVPAPATGDAAAGKVLGADGTWTTALVSLTFSGTIGGTKNTTAGATQGLFYSGTLPYSAVGNFASFNAASTTWTQIIVSNSSNTASASANIVVSNNSGTDTTSYGCLGINSDSFSGTACAGDLPTATYLCNSSGDLAIGTNTANAVHFFANYAVTDAITISATNIPSIFNGNLMSAATTNGQACQIQSLTELTTIAAAATTDTAIQMPAGAIILGVSVRVTTAVTCTSTFTVGDSGSAARFSTAAVSKAVSTTDRGTKAGAYYNASALAVRITPDTTPSDNTGRVRVTIHYITVTPPTS